jgi:hypothetical protein
MKANRSVTPGMFTANNMKTSVLIDEMGSWSHCCRFGFWDDRSGNVSHFEHP